jgi:hypothetical protein
MNIALLLPDPERDADMAEDIASTLAHLGHEITGPFDLSYGRTQTYEPPVRSLMISRGSVPLVSYLKAITLGHTLAAPPIHTLAILDHPLHWRRLLERVGVPLGRSVVLEASHDPRRDPQVSVLGFPLLVSEMSSSTEGPPRQAWDREELWEAVTEIRKRSPDVLLVSTPSGTMATWFTGIGTDEPISAGQAVLDADRRKLSLELVNHTKRLMELAGPCRIDLAWERDQLTLSKISHVTDLSRIGEAFQAVGGDYTSFVGGIVGQAFGRRGRI